MSAYVFFMVGDKMTAADILAKLLTVDGAGSGLDADTLDGLSSASFQLASGYTAADVLAKLLTVDGAGSLLDADTIDGIDSASLVQTTGVQTIGGAKTFTSNVTLSGNTPTFGFTELDAAADNQRWAIYPSSTTLRIQGLTDAGAGGVNLLDITRSGNNVVELRFGLFSAPWQIMNVSGITTTGFLKPGTPSSAVTAGAGAIRWDTATTKLQVSDGSTWINLH